MGEHTCKWREDGYKWDGYGYWETGCDNLFQFNTGGPEENRFKFCPYCGKPIEVVENEKELEN